MCSRANGTSKVICGHSLAKGGCRAFPVRELNFVEKLLYGKQVTYIILFCYSIASENPTIVRCNFCMDVMLFPSQQKLNTFNM